MAIGISMDWDGLHATLGRIAAIGAQPAPLLAAIGVALEDSTKRRFEDGEDPSGIKWASYAPLNPLYAADKVGTQILVASGTLRSTIYSGVVGNEVFVGSEQPYAAVHQFGAVIKPKNAKALVFMLGDHKVEVGSVTVPARPYLGLSDSDREMVVGELEDAFARAIGRG